VYRAFTSLHRADSVTVDPHKLGYLPYGAGGFVGADARMTHFVGQRPVYIYDCADAQHGDRLAQLGDYVLEGSKSGAAAAAAHVSHSVLPLDADHFGRVCGHTIRATEDLFDSLQAIAARLRGVCRIVLPVEPDTNLVCIAINPGDNRSLARMNAFGRALFRDFFALDPAHPQSSEFIGSHTSMLRQNLSAAAARKFAHRLGVDERTFTLWVRDASIEADHVFLLRHTLMNPWLAGAGEGADHLARYCEFLERAIRQTLAAPW
jgi:hypothetical protein